ncbi:MAG: NAD(P)-dependent oxidoreductase [Crocinitomicaceae bacterium]|nr:NAD(P)-dependent oxidoreductase [Crocinitomicaceae bacterium]
MEDPSVLITGATGAVGSEALKQLYAKQSPSSITVFVRPSKKAQKILRGFKGVNVVYGDVTNPKDVEKACKNIDYAFHLAAIIPPLADDKPALTEKVNVEGTRNVVNGLEAHSPNAFLLYSSSVATYGDRNKTPNIYTTDPLAPSVGDEYAVTKIAAEKIIRESKLNWSIYRLSAIMGIGNHKVSKLMFHMPLDTIMEIATVRDTARAFVNSVGKADQLNHNTYNLGGGEKCRISYIDFMTRAFDAYGMGKVNFPPYAFAKINFHCGNYADGDLLEEIIHFRSDTLDTYFERFAKAVPGIQRFFTTLVNKPVKMVLLKSSEPYHAHKKQDTAMIERFFGEDYHKN